MLFSPSLLQSEARCFSGIPQGSEGLILSELSHIAAKENHKTILYVAADDARAQNAYTSLQFFSPQNHVQFLPSWDCVPYDRTSPSVENIAGRLGTLLKLTQHTPPLVIVTSTEAVMRRFPPHNTMCRRIRNIEICMVLDPIEMAEWLTKNAYRHVSLVVNPGEYAIRGGLIDVFPINHSTPLRLDFFGNILETIREFNVDSQRSTGTIEHCLFMPASEVIFDDITVAKFRTQYREKFDTIAAQDSVYISVSEKQHCLGIENFLPLFYDKMETILDYMQDCLIVLDDTIETVWNNQWERIEERFTQNKSAPPPSINRKTEHSGVEFSHNILPTHDLFIDWDTWSHAIQRFPVYTISPHQLPPEPKILNKDWRQGQTFFHERKKADGSLFRAVIEHIRKKISNGSIVVVASYSEGSSIRLRSLLRDYDLHNTTTTENWMDVCKAGNAGIVYFTVWKIPHGFETDTLTVISEKDIFGEALVSKPKVSRDIKRLLRETNNFSIGDIVVHKQHGIGRYQGLETLKIDSAPHDCLIIVYEGSDKLYLPIENIDLLSRYGNNENANLDKLGGKAWKNRKAKAKKYLLEIAEKLVHIAAMRATQSGENFSADPDAYGQFCTGFGHEETPDQISAIDDVIMDLSSGRPMNRIICGDVGFGKTEIAIRATFIVAMAGHQVAIITPTTLLARQHYQSFSNRFENWPFRIAQLSRLLTAKQIRDTQQALKEGKIDIIIGTHALLSKKVEFKSPGLLIVDEEHHFGVNHKEHLKQLSHNIHMLTMTATPIPRTLQATMSGISDLSLITTPPVDRLPVHTYVLPFDPITIRDAILREKHRGGQAFWIVPRIRDIAEAEAIIKQHLPEISCDSIHGQMPPSEIDKKINDFYDKKSDILVSTTIIESGIDVPSANTLIVQNPDMFGLAQLYQIRGRVGRSGVQAFAYFVTKSRGNLSANAERRLQILESLRSLGQNFELASHDLEIRGGGNILGEEQSGHIREIGIELYNSMLKDAVKQMQMGEKHSLLNQINQEESWSPQIDLGAPVLIPETYIQDKYVRFSLYNRLARMDSRENLSEFAQEISDRFGKPPQEVGILINIIQVKILCKKNGITKVAAGDKGVTFTFCNNTTSNMSALFDYATKHSKIFKIQPDNRLTILQKWSADNERILGTYKFLKKISAIINSEIA